MSKKDIQKLIERTLSELSDHEAKQLWQSDLDCELLLILDGGKLTSEIVSELMGVVRSKDFFVENKLRRDVN